MALINTVDSNMSSYIQCSYLKAQLACKLHHIISRPSLKEYKLYVANNYMVNLPISFTNVNASEDIFSKYKGYL